MAEQSTLAAAGGDPYADDPSVRPSNTPFWREMFFGADWLLLRMSPVYYGIGVPHGHGEPVVVVPGFLATDASMVELHAWLGRIGYRAYFASFGINADCPDHLAGQLLSTIKRAQRDTGQRVRLLGHSLGGMLARSVALDNPQHVSMVVSMGSPFREGVNAHPMIMSAADALRRHRGASGVGKNIGPSCFSGHCTCDFVKNMLNPADYEVAHYAIYSRTDGVVEWQNCMEEDPELNDEVTSTHIGMAFHPGVYRALAKRLANLPPDHKLDVPPRPGTSLRGHFAFS